MCCWDHVLYWLHAYIWSGKLGGICRGDEDHGTVVCTLWTGCHRSAADTPLSGRQEKKSMVEMKVLSSHEEWLKARTKIGGSDASAIFGMSPWKTNVNLWAEKVNNLPPVDISKKDCVRYGVAAEPLLRGLFALDYPELDVLYEENNIWFNDRYSWAHASLDGWLIERDTGSKGILEIKTTEIQSGSQRQKWGTPWKPNLPQNYYIQILHYLMVTEFDFVMLVGQLKSNLTDENGDPAMVKTTRHYRVNRSDDGVEEGIQRLAEEEYRFWKMIQERKEPPLILPEI